MLVLGIETSCDETAAAVVGVDRRVHSSVIFSQFKEHAIYGGVVPEIAARAHIRHLEPVIEQALKDASVTLKEIDAIAVTAGPGLIGGVIVGVMTAKAMAAASGKKVVAVNHLEAHALTARLTDNVEFPYLLLLASGGHCQFIGVEGVGKYKKLGGTVDDALGEAYDKVAKLLRMGMPGGPAVEKFAKSGNPKAHSFKVPMQGREGCDLSFSGLKTAVRMAVEGKTLSEQDKADICASFQHVAAESVADRLKNAMRLFKGNGNFVMAGGVAANQFLKTRLAAEAENAGMKLVVPPPALCTDNAAMIAWAGIERLKEFGPSELDFEPRARWPL